MTFAIRLPVENRRFAALGLTILVHLALFYGWRISTGSQQDESGGVVKRIQWLLVPPPPPPARTPTIVTAAPSRARTPSPAVRESRSVSDEQRVAAASESPIDPAPVSAPEGQSILDRAKASVGGIDRELRKANPNRFIRAPAISAMKRMQLGIQQANELAPNKWYQAPKITEIVDPGGHGRRRYRVVGARGTYCVTYESNHAPDGIDSMQHGIRPKVTACPAHEQSATTQDWTINP